MPTIYTYPDAYLSKFCTVAREALAIADVQALGTFSAYWEEKLVIVRTYILACLEHQADPEDLFSAKLKNYRTEFDHLLAQARAATENEEGFPLPVFSIPIERG